MNQQLYEHKAPQSWMSILLSTQAFKKKSPQAFNKKNYRAKYIARIFRNKHQLNLGPAWNMKISH